MPATSLKWYQAPLERFMDKVAIISVSTYRDRYLEELEKHTHSMGKRTERDEGVKDVSQKSNRK